MSQKNNVRPKITLKEKRKSISEILTRRKSLGDNSTLTFDLSLFKINHGFLFFFHTSTEGFIKYPELNQFLNEYVCKELNMENYFPLEFLTKIHQLEGISTLKEKEDLSKEIIKKFIQKDSEFGISISKETREEIFENFKQLTTGVSSDGKKLSSLNLSDFHSIFSDAKDSQLKEIIRDVFPRLIRTKKFTILISNYLTDPNILISKTSTLYPYNDQDFKKQFISEKDIKFMKHLSEDDLHWELLDSIQDSVNIFYSDINVLQNVKSVKNAFLIKFEIILPHSFEKSICCIVPTFEQKNVNSNFISTICLEKKSYKQLCELHKDDKEEILADRSFISMATDIQFEFPITTLRKQLTVNSCEFYDDKFMKIWKPCVFKDFDCENFEWSKKYKYKDGNSTKSCYLNFDFGCNIFQQLTENKTQYTEVHLGNYGGWAENLNLLKNLIMNRGHSVKNNLMKHLEKKQNLTFEIYEDDLSKDPFGKLVVESINQKCVKMVPKKLTKLKSIYL
jgi:hypothetical protein